MAKVLTLAGAMLGVSLLIPGASMANADESEEADRGLVHTEQADPNEVICRSERQTGTRIRERVCKTRREWEREREDSVEAIRDANQRGNTLRDAN